MRFTAALLALSVVLSAEARAHESLWIEAEFLQGIKGYCWPMHGKPDQRKTNGHWGLSGPGWASEWVQGGESNFLSIACAADDDKAVAATEVQVPVAGTYRVWVRFRDNRGCSSRFQVRLTPGEGAASLLTYGTKPIIEEDNEMKLYWNWAFAWEGHEAKLAKGKCKLELLSAFKEQECRQIDCIVLTTDPDYRPLIKERPRHPTTDILNSYVKGIDPKLEPLTRVAGPNTVPAALQPRTFRDKGFLYLWNMGQTKWAGSDPKRVLYPYSVADEDTIKAFEKKYGGAKDVPIFGDPRIVPAFHGSGPMILATDAKDAAAKQKAEDFVRWLDANPDRPWGMMMNYAGDAAITAEAKANFLKYRDRYVGSIAGESLGYFYVPDDKMKAATAKAKNRRELAEAITQESLAANAAKYKTVFGQDWPDAYREVIPCESVGMTAFAPLCYQWGARTVGYESAAVTAGLLPMRMAFLRGAARQNGGLTATYRSCNFGDSATIFSEQGSYTKPRSILDNYYSVYSGAGMTWYKMDIWYQYMSGSSMFYHEQGFDEFWMPGGTSAAGLQDVQLSPKGKLVDRFLRVTQQHKDRGACYTPVAFLVDYAHGWDPTTYQPHAFTDHAKRPDLTLYGDHEQMLQQYFWTAYHPITTKSQEPITGINEMYVPGVYGDVFDVIYAYPDAKRWSTIQHYPAVVAAGDIELTADEGKRLAQYVQDGGTLLIADTHLTGPGVAALELPAMAAAVEASDYTWAPTGAKHTAQRFQCRPITGGKALATTADGQVFCAAFDRGKGRLIVLSVPRGLGIDRTAIPVLPQLLAHLTRGLMPVEVAGDVEWLVNRTATSWLVTLMNPAGQAKPQQGITPTDYRENRKVTIRVAEPVSAASDWLFPDETLTPVGRDKGATLELVVPAGGVRIVELKTK